MNFVSTPPAPTDFENSLDVLAESLSINPATNADQLIKRFPDRKIQINRLVNAAQQLDSCSPEFGFMIPDGVRLVPPPKQVGYFSIGQRLGSGGMGNVFRADPLASNPPFSGEPVSNGPARAIKLIRADLPHAKFVERFRREQQLLRQVSHKFVVGHVDDGTTDEGVPYLMMELVEGSSLDTHFREQVVSMKTMLDIVIQVCEGLSAIHRCGIIHRDLKPANILVSWTRRGFVPKIIDFGLSKHVGEKDCHSEWNGLASQRLGTPHYMSPEQSHSGGDVVGFPSDIFSLGFVVTELVSAMLGKSDQKNQVRSRRGERALCHSLPGQHEWECLQQICRKATQLDPNQRYQTADDLAEAFSSIRSSL